MLQPGSINAITDFWNWINDGAGSGDVGLHGDFSSYDEWEEARGLVERGERKLSDYGGELPGIEPPEEWKRYCDWQRHFRLSEFGCGEWVELAQKMFDFTGDNVFVIGTVGEAPNILLTNNDLRNVPTDVLGRPPPVRPLPSRLTLSTGARSHRKSRSSRSLLSCPVRAR